MNNRMHPGDLLAIMAAAIYTDPGRGFSEEGAIKKAGLILEEVQRTVKPEPEPQANPKMPQFSGSYAFSDSYAAYMRGYRDGAKEERERIIALLSQWPNYLLPNESEIRALLEPK